MMIYEQRHKKHRSTVEREENIVKHLSPILDRYWPAIGYRGAVSCVTYVLTPVGGELPDIDDHWAVVYGGLSFNTFVCPNLKGDDAPQASPWVDGRLNFGCDDNLGDMWDLAEDEADLIIHDTPFAHSKKTLAWSSFVWGCTYFNTGDSNNVGEWATTYQVQTPIMGDQRHIHTQHLSRHACDLICKTGTNQAREYQKAQDYLINTDAGDLGYMGILHELGWYVANKYLHDDNYLENFLMGEFVKLYYTASPLHGFLWTVIAGRDTVNGYPVHLWAARQCIKFVQPSKYYASPSTADPNAHLFGECSHGIGHGSMARLGSNKMCKYDYSSVWSIHGVPDWVEGMFQDVCKAGADHQDRNGDKDTIVGR